MFDELEPMGLVDATVVVAVVIEFGVSASATSVGLNPPLTKATTPKNTKMVTTPTPPMPTMINVELLDFFRLDRKAVDAPDSPAPKFNPGAADAPTALGAAASGAAALGTAALGPAALGSAARGAGAAACA